MSSLKSQFNRARKPASSGSAAKTMTKKNKWLLDKFGFLIRNKGERPSISNIGLQRPQTPPSEVKDRGSRDDDDDEDVSVDIPFNLDDSFADTGSTKRPLIAPRKRH
ncbi:hypothetical protein LOTGIDRAFT_167023 [Lottia gigantea]|uniref:Uncharacterized protein n=1 Tax=Lottia gigantea TaxID=225164 RepID=V3ZV95_LOTGI|nr:hypothetical protein LOTGIDRAFT_167023 [Lottia gigantea]ESO86505.1 hypothetical protein LOTGIDRAFT_167023 [Lottia gigantea]